MKKLIGMFAVLATVAILFSAVLAQDVAPPAGKGKGGQFGGGKGGGLVTPDNFMAKYDPMKTGKVTKDQYMKVAADDAKTQWEAIDSKKSGTVTTEEYTKYYDDKKAAFGGKGKGGAPQP